MSPDDPSLSPADLLAARATADRFLAAVKGGDEATARSLLIVREGEKVDFKSMKDSTGSYRLGEAKAEGGRAIVEATVVAGPGPEDERPLPVVLVRPEETWKIDMGASIERMLGGIDIEGMMRQMAEGVGQMMAKGLEAIGEGLSGLADPPAGGAPADPAPPPPAKPAPKRRRKG